MLKELWHPTMSISIPFYDSFLFKNVLEQGQCVPDFTCKPTFFIESNNLPFDLIVREKVVEYAAAQNYPVIRAKSIYYNKYDDFKAYQTHRAIANRGTLSKPELNHCSSNSFCFEDYWLNKTAKSAAELEFIGSFEPRYNLPFHGIRLPSVKVDAKVKAKIKVKSNCTNFELLKALCKEGFLRKRADNTIKEDEIEWYRSQCTHELKLLNELGFVDYVLIVWDMINFCRENDIPVGRGRGSAAGSVVLYYWGLLIFRLKGMDYYLSDSFRRSGRPPLLLMALLI